MFLTNYHQNPHRFGEYLDIDANGKVVALLFDRYFNVDGGQTSYLLEWLIDGVAATDVPLKDEPLGVCVPFNTLFNKTGVRAFVGGKVELEFLYQPLGWPERLADMESLDGDSLLAVLTDVGIPYTVRQHFRVEDETDA